MSFTFSFPDCGTLGRPVIEIEGVTFGYGAQPLFADVHLGVQQASRVALVGPNGSGKSTLLNLIQGVPDGPLRHPLHAHLLTALVPPLPPRPVAGKINPTDGIIHVNPQLRLGIFTQHHLDSFDLRLSALDNMMQRWPLAAEAGTVRCMLLGRGRRHIGRRISPTMRPGVLRRPGRVPPRDA